MKYSEIPVAQTVLLSCLDKGIRHVVISPGSRNAPLTLSFTAHPDITAYSIVDERCAAFFALGIAQQIQQPVAVICSSGSALLNYYPAIAEAFYSNIPLVVLSADRPVYRIDIGDGQTIRQTGVFEPHLEASADLKPDVSHNPNTLLENPMQKLLPATASQELILKTQKIHQKHNEQEIARVFLKALTNRGPVHLNIPMEEPLYGMTEDLIPIGETAVFKPSESILESDFEMLKEQWHRSTKKWVIIGQMSPGTLDQEVIDRLCLDPSVVVFTETTSNISHPNLIHSIDSLMAPAELLEQKIDSKIAPELLLTFGGMVVSKKIKFFLRKHRPQHHWHVDIKKAYNTYYCLDRHFKMSPQAFLNNFYSENSPLNSSTFQGEVLNFYQKFIGKGQPYLNQLPFSDLAVFRFLSKKIPNQRQLQIANSSSIRYTQLFTWPQKTEFYCNRGTSGIDGSTSTAVGAALSSSLPTLLITGDLSFFTTSTDCGTIPYPGILKLF
jgi:2-succinyl-5-enolpyruvyl-6-hydroxy-3-cyclohexene-1-carboxylate synthase